MPELAEKMVRYGASTVHPDDAATVLLLVDLLRESFGSRDFYLLSKRWKELRYIKAAKMILLLIELQTAGQEAGTSEK